MSAMDVGKLDDFILRCLASGRWSVSHAGEVISERYKGTQTRRALKGIRNLRGYLQCSLRFHGETHMVLYHRVVLLGTAGKPPFVLADVNHKNGDKHDNRPENLEWVTRRQNICHAYLTGLNDASKRAGSNHVFSKLSDLDVQNIFEKHATGLSYGEIAKGFGVHKETIGRILRRESYRIGRTSCN